MITREQALETARAWALASLPSGDGEVNLWEFDLCYVAAHVPPPRAPGTMPSQLGAPKAVIDKESGELSVWPSLSPELVAERYQRDRAARQRLPEDVREVLTAAGWRSARDISARIDAWLAKLYEEQPAARDSLPLFPAAKAALAEFGGLRFKQLTRPGYAGGGFAVETWPDVGRVVLELYTDFAADLGARVFPFAWYEDGPSDAVVAEDGRVFLLHPAGLYLLGETVDAAVIELVRGPELREVDEHGTPLD